MMKKKTSWYRTLVSRKVEKKSKKRKKRAWKSSYSFIHIYQGKGPDTCLVNTGLGEKLESGGEEIDPLYEKTGASSLLLRKEGKVGMIHLRNS